MWNIEDVLSELAGEDELGKLGLAAGFRFHPTDEELISYYLASKVFNHYPSSSSTTTSTFFSFSALNIPQVDLNRIEPWDLPERAKIGEREWYFYSVRDRKYPTGLRTNRATATGYWKATGKDKHVYSSSSSSNNNNNNNNNKNKGVGVGVGVVGLIGMKKTLVFYQGRAPRGLKTPWVMHEYRLDGHFSSFRLSSSKEEWVICRIFHKNGIGSGNENKKPIRASFHNYNNFMMMNSSSSLPPHLVAATTTSMPAFTQPPLFFNDDFGLNLPLPSITTTTTMKQEQNDLNWLEKIITPHHQLFNNNPPSFYHHNPGLGPCLEYNLASEIALSKSSQELFNNIPDAAVSLAALDPLINLVP